MVAMIPEAVEAASSAGEAAAGTRAAAAGRHRKPVTRVQAGRERRAAQDKTERAAATRFRQQQSAAQAEARRQQSVQKRRQERIKGGVKRAGRGALKARLPGQHTYQPVILAEFLVAVVIVAVSPVAKGGTGESQAKGSPSPYSVNSLKQLVAIGGVYFVLAILASSRRAGRLAAWFGGLVLLGLGFTELLNGDLKALFGVFGPSSGAKAAGPTGTTGGGPLFAPGVPEQVQQAAQNALGPQPGALATEALAPVTTQSITFSQPGVATTTETSPGVQVT